MVARREIGDLAAERIADDLSALESEYLSARAQRGAM